METVITEDKALLERTKKSLLWVAMVSMVMVFGGLTSAYAVRMEKGDWLDFDLPRLFYVSTALILLSSITMNQVLSSAKTNNYAGIKRAAGLTLLLGIVFIASQFKAWEVLYSQKVVLAGSHSNAAGSFLYILTGLHMIHLVGGVLALLVVWIRALQKKYNAENLLGIKLCAIFWHFLGALWVYLFLFLLFVR